MYALTENHLRQASCPGMTGTTRASDASHSASSHGSHAPNQTTTIKFPTRPYPATEAHDHETPARSPPDETVRALARAGNCRNMRVTVHAVPVRPAGQRGTQGGRRGPGRRFSRSCRHSPGPAGAGGRVGEAQITIFWPVGSVGVLPVVLYTHGAGWVFAACTRTTGWSGSSPPAPGQSLGSDVRRHEHRAQAHGRDTDAQ
jgi:hypothetical protein